MTIEPGRRQALRIRVGRLLDGTTGPAVEDGAILIVGERIAAVGPDAAVPCPDDARTLELPQATALPGLIDAYVHVALPPTVDPLRSIEAESDDDLVVRGAAAAERMVRAGITTAYDCGARGMTAYWIRDAIQRGLEPGSAPAGQRPADHQDRRALPLLRWRGRRRGGRPGCRPDA